MPNGGSNRARWTEEETALFQKYYPIRTSDELAEIFPNYTWEQMKGKASRMGLKKKPEVAIESRIRNGLYKKEDLWTDEEVKILFENYPDKGSKGVQEALPRHRNINSIRRKAESLGVRKNYNGSFWDMIDMDVHEQSLSVTVKFKKWGR